MIDSSIGVLREELPVHALATPHTVNDCADDQSENNDDGLHDEENGDWLGRADARLVQAHEQLQPVLLDVLVRHLWMALATRTFALPVKHATHTPAEVEELVYNNVGITSRVTELS